MLAWPPDYQLKVSSKAKYLQLKIMHSCNLQVIVPKALAKKLTPAAISEFIETKKAWIGKHLLHAIDASLPQEIALFNLEIFKVTYHLWPRNTLKQLDYQLILKSPTLEKHKLLLRQWLKKYAKSLLIPLTNQLAQITNLTPALVNVREQKNLWGNCSSKQVINLNYKLIFLPLNLVRHVILHELAHLKHLNHSTKFWDLLQKLDVAALEHNQQLKSANSYVPRWIY